MMNEAVWIILGLAIGLYSGGKLEELRWRGKADKTYGRMGVYSGKAIYYVVEECEYMELIDIRQGARESGGVGRD